MSANFPHPVCPIDRQKILRGNSCNNEFWAKKFELTRKERRVRNSLKNQLHLNPHPSYIEWAFVWGWIRNLCVRNLVFLSIIVGFCQICRESPNLRRKLHKMIQQFSRPLSNHSLSFERREIVPKFHDVTLSVVAHPKCFRRAHMICAWSTRSNN